MPKKKKTVTVSLIPGADTPEGAARLQKELEARNDIDFRAFQALQRLNEEGLVSRFLLAKQLREHHGESKSDATEWANEIMDEIEEIIRARRLADHKVLAAAAGRPE